VLAEVRKLMELYHMRGE
jgi:hypothetical protein